MFDEAKTKLLKLGAVGVLPTDTLYGLVARAVDEEAVARLYNLKHRDKKPGTVVADSVEQLVQLGLKRRYLTAVEQYWPGPVSVVVPTGEDLAYLHQGVQSLAVRIPADEQLRELLKTTGPLLTTSANSPAKPPAETVDMARQYFGSRVDFYVDGGPKHNAQPSTVIRIIDDAIEILRQGATSIQESGRIEP